MIPGVIGHLWQSTLFGGVAWLAALTLRTDRAEVRHWIWFAASAKFLIPFSLLVGLGALMPHSRTAAPVRTEWTSALQEFGQPITLLPATAQVGVAAGATKPVYLTACLALWGAGSPPSRYAGCSSGPVCVACGNPQLSSAFLLLSKSQCL